MKIVVCVKYVPDATGERSFADDRTVDREAADGLLSELDEYAVEQALRIADDGDDVEVVALTVGPGRRRRRDQAGAADGCVGRDPRARRRDPRLGRARAPARSWPPPSGKPSRTWWSAGWPPPTARWASSRRCSPSGSAGRRPRCGATLSLEGRTVTIRARHRHRQPDGAGRPAGRGQRDRPVRRGALPVDEGHPRRQEEAGRGADLDDLGIDAGRRRSGRRPGPRSSRRRRGRPRRPGRVVTDEDGSGAAALVEFLAAGKYI